MSKKKPIDPIPEEFSSYGEAAEFWDSHDTTDYPDAFSTVEMIGEFHGRQYEVAIEPEIVSILQERAKSLGVTASHLASDIIRQYLLPAS